MALRINVTLGEFDGVELSMRVPLDPKATVQDALAAIRKRVPSVHPGLVMKKLLSQDGATLDEAQPIGSLGTDFAAECYKVRWLFRAPDGGPWTSYTQGETQQIEEAFQSRQEDVRLIRDGKRYTLTFGSRTEMGPRGECRELRRQLYCIRRPAAEPEHRGTPPAPNMRVRIQLLDGKSFEVGTHPLHSVHHLKVKIQDVEGIPPDQIRLIVPGKEMQDGRTLESYNVQNGSTVHLCMPLRGMFSSTSGKSGFAVLSPSEAAKKEEEDWVDDWEVHGGPSASDGWSDSWER